MGRFNPFSVLGGGGSLPSFSMPNNAYSGSSTGPSNASGSLNLNFGSPGATSSSSASLLGTGMLLWLVIGAAGIWLIIHDGRGA